MTTRHRSFSKSVAGFALIACLGMVRGSLAGLGGNITVYADPEASECAVTDDAVGPITVYVFHTNIAVPIYSSKFRVVESAGFSATFVSQNVLFAGYVGSFRDGIDMPYGGCFTGSLLLGTIVYEGHGTSAGCSYIDVAANPNPPGIFPFPAAASCHFDWYEAWPIGKLYVNPVEGECEAKCGSVVAVQGSTWGHVKALYR